MAEKAQLREYIRWLDSLLRSMESSLKHEDPANLWKHSGYKEFARKFRQLAVHISAEVQIPPIVEILDDQKIPGSTSTIAMQQKEFFEAVHVNASVLKGYLESQLGIVDDEVAGLREFLQSRLRSSVLRLPERERDIQDSLEQLLIGRGLTKGQDYDREVGRVKVSVKEVVPDFVLPKLSLALEVKFLKDSSRPGKVVDEINADIVAYRKRYQRVLFVVYDMGLIRDEREFRHGLETVGAVYVVIVKH